MLTGRTMGKHKGNPDGIRLEQIALDKLQKLSVCLSFIETENL